LTQNFNPPVHQFPLRGIAEKLHRIFNPGAITTQPFPRFLRLTNDFSCETLSGCRGFLY